MPGVHFAPPHSKIMRIDHHAYQRATRVAGFGLMLQASIGILLLVFGLVAQDSVFQFSSLFALTGLLVWLGLVIVFHQHKLERLEALEEDELASTRVDAQSIFDRTASETRVAARRLALMHKWLMPGLSLLVALLLGLLAWRMLAYMRLVANNQLDFHSADQRGWAVAICLAVAAVAFIFSRFVAGMAKLDAWQNLRGGASWMVGTALLMVAVATGIIFRFFENESVIQWVAWAIPAFMIALTLEILLNFVLNLYRPRIPGEVPRPAFDSKVLSLFAAPDNIVRSLNEAVNYQFGFDVTSSWGYRLLLRSVAALAALGVGAMVLLSTMVVVEPHQQAIRLRGGAIVDGRIHQSGIMWKLPWPFETAEVYDVSRVRDLHLTPRVLEDAPVSLWDTEEPPKTDVAIEPFLVGSTPEQAALEVTAPVTDELNPEGQPAAPTEEDIAAQKVSQSYSLVDAEIVMQYRIKAGGQGLLDYLNFAPEFVSRRQNITDRERAIRNIALKEVSQHLATQSLDRVLSPGDSDLAMNLRSRVQVALDAQKAGVEVIAIDLPMLRPSGGSAKTFEELSVSAQVREEVMALANRDVIATYATFIGDGANASEVMAELDKYNQMREEKGRGAAQDPEVVKQRQIVENLLVRGGGQAAQMISQEETDRWVTLMNRRSQDSMVKSQLASYLAAPELYRQRSLMILYKTYLPFRDKVLIAVDPSRVKLDFDLQKVNPILDFAGASESEVNK